MTPSEVYYYLQYIKNKREAADRRVANLMATVLNAAGGKRGGRAFRAEDFLKTKRTAKTPAEQAAYLKNITRVLGGKIGRKNS